MVISEFYRIREDGVNLFRIYSDKGFEIKHISTGEIFGDVIETEDACKCYTETSKKVPMDKIEESTTGGE